MVRYPSRGGRLAGCSAVLAAAVVAGSGCATRDTSSGPVVSGPGRPAAATAAAPARPATPSLGRLLPESPPASGSVLASGPVPVSDSAPASARRPAEARGPGLPVRLVVPAIGLDSAVHAQGAAADGTLEPPPGQVVAYTGPPDPAVTHVTVLAGHVTYGEPDVFWHLDRVRPGDRVEVGYAGASPRWFVVTASLRETKQAAARDHRIWGESPTPVLVLMTCDKGSRVGGHAYAGNLVVLAAPIGAHG